MKRHEAIKAIMDCVTDEPVICTLGHPSQELYAIKDRPENFYMLGSMGLASSIGLGLAMAIDKRVIVIDGDGALLMNLGSLATIGAVEPKNLVLVIMDNESYGSTGGQPSFTMPMYTELSDVAEACGIDADTVYSKVELQLALKKRTFGTFSNEPRIIVVKIKGHDIMGAPPVLLSPVTIRNRFKEAICLAERKD